MFKRIASALAAAAVVATVPPGVSAQSSVPVPSAPSPTAAQTGTTPAGGASQGIVIPNDTAAVQSQVGSATQTPVLPTDPGALLAPKATGILRTPGSGVTFVPAAVDQVPGGGTVERAKDEALPLSLDDAISLGLTRNLSLKYQTANQRAVRGYQGQIRNAVIPNLQFKASSSAQQLNLAALGFNPAKIGPLLTTLGLDGGSLQTIVKVNTTSVQLSLSQQLFNMPDFALFRAIKPEFKSVDLNVEDTREQLVQAVANAYLRVLADQANLSNTEAQENSARALLDQATQRDQAGIGIRLDVLRAQVELQQREQARVSAETQLDKDGIQLNRTMGLPAGQQIDLTDRTPYQEFGSLNLDEARDTALSHRSDLLALQQSLEVASLELKAIRYQRLPTLSVSGYYGVLGETTGLYHGVFNAQGNVRVPVFREAAQRGEQASAEAQVQQLRDQEDNLRGTIEAQIRTSLLDVDTAAQLVKVARSNVDLAKQELGDAQSRFASGVTDNLEVVDAESAVTGAQAQLVTALFQFNTAKVGLARSAGVLQSRYRGFLGM